MAQVTAGGIDPFDFSADTMESRLYEGLYAAGEILDVDGRLRRIQSSMGVVDGWNGDKGDYK